MVASGAVNTLVESNAPPSPVSRHNKSAGWRENASNAAAVVTSKKVTWLVPLTVSTSSRRSASAASSISVPASLMRSLNRHKCGEL